MPPKIQPWNCESVRNQAIRLAARRAIQREGLGTFGPRELWDERFPLLRGFSTCFAPGQARPTLGPVRRSAGAPQAVAFYFKNLVASKASFRWSMSQAVRAIRAARMEIALALPCCFSFRAT